MTCRRSFVTVVGGVTYLKKYDKPSPYADFIPVIRYSEVLLNYAEAAAKTGDQAKSLELLKAVRLRSDPTYTFPVVKIETAEAIFNSVLLERRIEFLGEGFRSNDLLRNLLLIPSKGSGGLVSPAILPAQASYIFPLPNSEILTNKLLL